MATFVAAQGFVPLGSEIPGINQSVVGALTSRVPTPSRSPRLLRPRLYERRGGGDVKDDADKDSGEEKNGSLLLLLVVIMITIIIFVTIIAAYDVIREKLSNHYAERALRNKRSHNTKQDIDRTLIANEEAYNSSIAFAFFSLAIALFVLPILFVAYYKIVHGK